jgi:hypothetical protein
MNDLLTDKLENDLDMRVSKLDFCPSKQRISSFGHLSQEEPINLGKGPSRSHILQLP